MSRQREVLQVFKSLHRTAQRVFKGDARAIEIARDKINSEFKSNTAVQSSTSINELINLAKDSEMVLRKTVIQLEEKKPGLYRVNIREETEFLDNIPFREDISAEEYKSFNRKSGRRKCSDKDT